MGYVETQLPNGGVITEWVSPVPEPTHKTEGLTQGDWYRLFTGPELTMHNRLKAYINDMSYDFSSFLPGHAILDTPATALGREDASYRDLMRDVFEIFDKATYPPGISCTSPRVAFAMQVQIALGLISSQARSDEILLGLPL